MSKNVRKDNIFVCELSWELYTLDDIEEDLKSHKDSQPWDIHDNFVSFSGIKVNDISSFFYFSLLLYYYIKWIYNIIYVLFYFIYNIINIYFINLRLYYNKWILSLTFLINIIL